MGPPHIADALVDDVQLLTCETPTQRTVIVVDLRKHVQGNTFPTVSTVFVPGFVHSMLAITHETFEHAFARAFEVMHDVAHTSPRVERCPQTS